MADPVKSITKFVDLHAFNITQSQTAINDMKVTMEASGFVCIHETIAEIALNEGVGSRPYAVLLFQKESLLVPGNGSVKVIKKTIGHADLTDVDTSEIEVFDDAIPAGALVVGRAIRLVTAFSGGAVSACVVDFGDGVDADGYFVDQDVFTGAATGMIGKPSTAGALITGSASDISLTARTPAVQFDSVGGNVADLTAGSLTAYVWFVEQALGAAVP